MFFDEFFDVKEYTGMAPLPVFARRQSQKRGEFAGMSGDAATHYGIKHYAHKHERNVR